MAQNVQAHESDEDRHSETGKYIGTGEAKGMFDAAALPDFEVSHNIYNDADGGSSRVEEKKT